MWYGSNTPPDTTASVLASGTWPSVFQLHITSPVLMSISWISSSSTGTCSSLHSGMHIGSTAMM